MIVFRQRWMKDVNVKYFAEGSKRARPGTKIRVLYVGFGAKAVNGDLVTPLVQVLSAAKNMKNLILSGL